MTNVVKINPLPDWLDTELWEDFKQHRKELDPKKPLTPTAEKRAIQKLERMKRAGQDIEAVIEKSIENGYKGLFPIIENKLDAKDGENIKSIAKRLGIEPKPGETIFEFNRRVMEANRG